MSVIVMILVSTYCTVLHSGLWTCHADCCFPLAQDTWTVSSIMFENKLLHACAVNSVPEIVINGGYSFDSTWTTADGETFGILPPMPLGMHDHCLVALGTI